MTESSELTIGDVVVEVPAYTGQQPNAQQFIIIATYKNANGFWHVAETKDANGLVVQVPLNDGGPYLRVVGHQTSGTTRSEETNKEIPTDSINRVLESDIEKIAADFRRVFGWIGKML